jgi:N-acetylglutamate synthase-like GNAT family acetyltransferase
MEKYIVSNNKSKLDINLIHSFLSKTDWAKGRTLAEVKKTVTNSDCFGIYIDDQQIGFARVLTDYTAIAYLLDVFIIEPFRGKGYSKKLLFRIFEDSKYLNVKKWLLATTDAHGLYQKFGFKQLESPDKLMQKVRSNDT